MLPPSTCLRISEHDQIHRRNLVVGVMKYKLIQTVGELNDLNIRGQQVTVDAVSGHTLLIGSLMNEALRKQLH